MGDSKPWLRGISAGLGPVTYNVLFGEGQCHVYSQIIQICTTDSTYYLYRIVADMRTWICCECCPSVALDLVVPNHS